MTGPPKKPRGRGAGTKSRTKSRAKGPAAGPDVKSGTLGRRRWRGLAPEDRDARRHARLLEAGLETFSRDGYAATSVAAVCGEAGVSTRNFYECYQTREDLLIDVYEHVIGDVVDAMNAALESEPADLGEMVAAGVRASLGALVDDERKARINCTEVVGVSRRVEQHRREGLMTIRKAYDPHLERLGRAGQLPDRDLSFAVVGAIGAFNEMLAAWMELDDRPPFDWLCLEVSAVTRAALSSNR